MRRLKLVKRFWFTTFAAILLGLLLALAGCGQEGEEEIVLEPQPVAFDYTLAATFGAAILAGLRPGR